MGVRAQRGIDATQQASAPSTPPAGRRLLYPKAGGWYARDSAGAEVPVDTIPASATAPANRPGQLWYDPNATDSPLITTDTSQVISGSKTFSGGLLFTPVNAASVPAISRGLASQTGDLHQWRSSADVVLARVAADGTHYEGARRVTPLTSRLTSAATSTSTTYSSTGLSVTVTSGAVYKFRAMGQYRSAATGTGLGLRMNGTATATGIRHYIRIWGSATSASTPLQTTHNTLTGANLTTATFAATTDYLWEIEGLIRVNVGGTFGVEFASEVAASTVTIQPDSLLMLEEVA